MKKYKRGTRRRERVEITGNPYHFIMKYNMTQLKHEIIMFLYEMRIATVEQLYRKFSQYSPRWIRENLMDLYENNFIYRKYMHMFRGSGGGIYYLDNLGAFYIAANEEIEKKDVNWDPRDNAVGIEKSGHTISITEIRVILEEIQRKDRFKLLKFVGSRQVGRIKYIFQGEQLEFTPDAEIIIQNDGYMFYYFLEYDTGTETPKKIEEKLKRYEMFYSSEEIKVLYPVEPAVLVICENEISEHRFKKVLKQKKSLKELKFYICGMEKFKNNPLGYSFIDIDNDEKYSMIN